MNLPKKYNFFERVPFLEKTMFTRHLAIMIKAGITVSEALDTLADQTKSPVFKKILLGILHDVQNGQSLCQALKKYDYVFDSFYTSLVQVGEESGTLEENLEFLAKQLDKEYSLRKKIQGAMMYPTLVLSATIIMGGFISLFVLPKLVDFFQAFEVELPLSTKILLFIANTMKNYGILIFSGFLGFLVMFTIFINLPKIRPWWDTLILKIPIFGKLLQYGQLAGFSRNLGTMLKSGVAVNKSLLITANTLSNLKFKNDLNLVASSLEKGKDIGSTLKDKKFWEFPSLVDKMIAVGEKTGKLEETLLYLGDFYEEEIDNISKNLTTILEPILLITIGLVVGFVALAIISPIYQLTGSINR